MSAEKKEKKSNSSGASGSSTPTGTEKNLGLSIPTDSSSEVELLFKVANLKTKSQSSKWFAQLAKPTSPEALCNNAQFDTFQLGPLSLKMKFTVTSERKKDDREQGGEEEVEAEAQGEQDEKEVFEFNWTSFPSPVDPVAVKFDVRQSSRSKYAFICLKMKKTGRGSAGSWQEALADK